MVSNLDSLIFKKTRINNSKKGGKFQKAIRPVVRNIKLLKKEINDIRKDLRNISDEEKRTSLWEKNSY